MPHYYSKKQTSQLNLKKINIKLKKTQFELYSGSGVFSKNKLDKGSKLLIENAIIEPKDYVLDLGCGIGVIGISLKLLYPNIKVKMLDINNRAIKLCRKNIKLHNLEDIDVVNSNLYEKIDEKFDAILVNPPQTAGREVCFKIIEQAPNYLNKKGLFQLVARHNKGGKVLEKKMHEVFKNSEQIAKGSGFRIYVSKKN
jgi:16S rRNA G1207 methylase RsmC